MTFLEGEKKKYLPCSRVESLPSAESHKSPTVSGLTSVAIEIQLDTKKNSKTKENFIIENTFFIQSIRIEKWGKEKEKFVKWEEKELHDRSSFERLLNFRFLDRLDGTVY